LGVAAGERYDWRTALLREYRDVAALHACTSGASSRSSSRIEKETGNRSFHIGVVWDALRLMDMASYPGMASFERVQKLRCAILARHSLSSSKNLTRHWPVFPL